MSPLGIEPVNLPPPHTILLKDMGGLNDKCLTYAGVHLAVRACDAQGMHGFEYRWGKTEPFSIDLDLSRNHPHPTF